MKNNTHRLSKQKSGKTACIHLYVNPFAKNGKGDCNVYIDGQDFDLQALLITAARINEEFYNALFSAASFIIRDESGSDLAGKEGES